MSSTLKIMPRWITQISPGSISMHAELGAETQSVLLRNNQQFAIRIEEVLVLHRTR